MSTTFQLKNNNKIHYLFKIKSQQKTYRRNVLQHNEGHYVKPTANIIFSSEKLNAFLQDQEKDKDAYLHHFYSTLYWKSQLEQLDKKKNKQHPNQKGRSKKKNSGLQIHDSIYGKPKDYTKKTTRTNQQIQ